MTDDDVNSQLLTLRYQVAALRVALVPVIKHLGEENSSLAKATVEELFEVSAKIPRAAGGLSGSPIEAKASAQAIQLAIDELFADMRMMLKMD